MFKNLMIYRLGPAWPTSAAQWEDALAQELFAECGTTQQKSIGWVGPRGVQHGALVEAVAGQWVARFAVETRSVPADALRRKVQEAVDHIEATTGRRPGKREQRDMRDDALLALLPQAFPRRSQMAVWLDPHTRLLALDASAQGKADEALESLVRVAGRGFTVAPLQTRRSPQAAMAGWLTGGDELPQDFDVGRNCELKGSGDEPAVIKFTRHEVATDEVRQHITEGKLPIRLALGWRGRVAFTLTDALQIRQIAFDDGVFAADRSVPADERFDADVALATGELAPLVADLVTALGGEAEPATTHHDVPVAAAA